jgi:hypothetical protein
VRGPHLKKDNKIREFKKESFKPNVPVFDETIMEKSVIHHNRLLSQT